MAEMAPVKTLNYRRTVPPSTAVIISKTPHLKGTVKKLTGHWPSGCASLVWIAFYITTRRIWPKDTALPVDRYVALDDTTKEWDINEPITKGDVLEVEMINYDIGNPHTPSIILSVEMED